MGNRTAFTPAAISPIALFAVVELVGVGGIGAWLAVKLHFPYTALTPVSFLVYGAAGFYACRAGAAGWIAGAIVGFLDAVTWATFGGIGPQPTDPTATQTGKIATVVFVTLLGALCGFIGARLQRRRTKVP
jgi:Na+/proline symporter